MLMHVIALLAFAAGPASKPTTCRQTAGYRDFDFWLGEWEVRNSAGKIVGRSVVESILDGCVVFENWRGASGNSGKSFNRFDPQTGKWHQMWVDNEGAEINFYGGLDGAVMRLVSQQVGKNGKTMTRMSFTPLEGGRVRQLWEQAGEDGVYKTLFDGTYARVKKP